MKIIKQCELGKVAFVNTCPPSSTRFFDTYRSILLSLNTNFLFFEGESWVELSLHLEWENKLFHGLLWERTNDQ